MTPEEIKERYKVVWIRPIYLDGEVNFGTIDKKFEFSCDFYFHLLEIKDYGLFGVHFRYHAKNMISFSLDLLWGLQFHISTHWFSLGFRDRDFIKKKFKK